VLVISDDIGFSRSVAIRWQAERIIPAFTMLSGELWPRTVEDFDVAIVGPLKREMWASILDSLYAAGQPLFCACEDAARAELVRERWPLAAGVRLDGNEYWMEGLILAAGEAVQRSRAEQRARSAEQKCALLERQATLGRYMLEMRHGLNNALTSLLGNSDLLLMEPVNLPAHARDQIETMRNMTLRIHEVMQRFSSLEKEMNVAVRQAERDAGERHHEHNQRDQDRPEQDKREQGNDEQNRRLMAAIAGRS
jgi:signal transduction histidine kinase